MPKKIYFDTVFVKHYRKRVMPNKKLDRLYKEKLDIFLENPFDIRLRNHKLEGKLKNKRAFFIDNDCRLIYIEEESGYLFLDIGKHDEVYRV